MEAAVAIVVAIVIQDAQDSVVEAAVVTVITHVDIIVTILVKAVVRAAANKGVQVPVKNLAVVRVLNFAVQIAWGSAKIDVFYHVLWHVEMIVPETVRIYVPVFALKDVQAAVLPLVDMAVEEGVITIVLLPVKVIVVQ